MATERLGDVRDRYRDEALTRGINPRDVDLLLGDLLNKSLPWLIAHDDERIDPAALVAMLERRFAGEPIQYIRGKTEFFSHQFYVDDRVLIPRPETEILVETVLERAPEKARVIDIGTGSGCIAISLELARRDLRVLAVDISPHALAVAHRNRRALQSNVDLVASDLLGAIRGEFDVIVSNPPYVADGELMSLALEVRQFEPRVALTSGPRGTETIERILDQAGEAMVAMEVGYGQEQAIRQLAEAKGFAVETFIPDLAGIPRVVVLSKHG